MSSKAFIVSDPVTYEMTHLENGLTIATSSMPHMASISLGLFAGVGSRYESAEWSGVSHFIEHILFKGTQRRTARQISEAVEGLGGSHNAYTSEDHTSFYAKSRYDHCEEVLDVLADMFVNSAFDPAEIEKEREVIKEELSMYLDDPHQHVQELLNEAMWPDQPLGRSITGKEESIARLKRPELMQFKQTHYGTEGVWIVAAGKLSHRKIVQMVKSLCKAFPRGPRPQYSPATSKQEAPVLRLFTKATEQTQLALGFRTCSRHDPQRFALRLLNAILGENASSRLFQILREDNGMAYNIYSAPSHFDDVGDLVISAGVDTDALPRAVPMILKELRRLSDKPPSVAELQRARDYITGQFDLSLENTESRMMWLGEQLAGYGRLFSPAHVKRELNRVRPEDIRAAALAFLRPERLNLALVSPLKSDRSLRKLLAF